MKIYSHTKPRYKYTYRGNIYDFKRNPNVLLEDAEFTTVGISLPNAVNNILNQARKRLGLTKNTKLLLDRNNVIRGERMPPLPERPILYCQYCGSRLTDGGHCPKCSSEGYEIDYL